VTVPFTSPLRPDGRVVERWLSDMRALYLESEADDRLVYRVYGLPIAETTANVVASTTVIEPGTVGREYHMTKGHFHSLRDRSEVYLTLSGEGRLVMATEDGRNAVEPMRPGTVNFVPGGWGHRSVNVGDEPLVFFAAYVGDAGHDYEAVAERGRPVLVVAGPDGPEVVENPRFGS
jgi:glucose-6-phosphate isomerase